MKRSLALPMLLAPLIGVPLVAAAQSDKAAQAAIEAAKRGDAKAQYDLGRSVAQNYEEAGKWYRRAADRGDARAQLLLGNFCQFGQGVAKNAIVAYALYTVSAGTDPRGNPAASHCAQMARGMSAEDVTAAGNLAAEMSKPGSFAPALDRYLAIAPKR